MATDLRNLPAFLPDDATFRTWGGGIAAQLAVVGLVQASDTGQINWTTVTRPGAINTYAGYEIWRFDDSLQATKPVFVKLEYGVAGALDRPALRAIVCTATNGAGAPAGQVGAAMACPASASKTAGATLPSYCSGSSSRLNLCSNLDTSAATFALTLMVERTKTAGGVDTSDAVAAFAQRTAAFQFIPHSGTITTGTANPALDLNLGGASVSGADVLLAPTVCFYGKALFASWCSYRNADTTALTPITFDHLGATRTYMPLGLGTASTSTNLPGSSSIGIATLWE